MGREDDDPGTQTDTEPRHQVVLDAFWIDRTETTNATFATCVAAGICEARPAERGTDARTYPWGDNLDCAHASYLGCTDDTTDVEIPQAGASSYGALNLAGNVWEWVSDWYSDDYYATSPRRNPTGPLTGEDKVRRGGGFSSLAREVRVTSRASGRAQHYFDGQMGFRCALSNSSS